MDSRGVFEMVSKSLEWDMTIGFVGDVATQRHGAFCPSEGGLVTTTMT